VKSPNPNCGDNGSDWNARETEEEPRGVFVRGPMLPLGRQGEWNWRRGGGRKLFVGGGEPVTGGVGGRRKNLRWCGRNSGEARAGAAQVTHVKRQGKKRGRQILHMTRRSEARGGKEVFAEEGESLRGWEGDRRGMEGCAKIGETYTCASALERENYYEEGREAGNL